MDADPADPHVARVATLPCWQAEVTIAPLGGGITNRNFVVVDGESRYVTRICEELPHLGIERRNEVVCQKAAHQLGIAPEVRFSEPGVLVSEFLEARTCSDDDLRDLDLLRRVATTLRSLHDSWDRVTGEMLYFSPFQTVQTYAVTARTLGAQLPDDIGAFLDDARTLAREVSPFTPTLCHNDLLAANVLNEGEMIYLVDWEYAGMGNRLFDLASVSSNAGLSDELEAEFLLAYRGELRNVDVQEVRILKTVSLLREALWAYIQAVASDIDFDYCQYASDNLSAYQKARAAMR